MIKYCEHCEFCEVDNYQRLTSWDEWESDGEVKLLNCKVLGERLATMMPRDRYFEIPSRCPVYTK
jgi:hypothetical protein